MNSEIEKGYQVDWFQRHRKPPFPEGVRVVARFAGRIIGNDHPAGTAVSGDFVPDEASRALPQILLQDGASLADRLQREAIPGMDAWISGKGPDPVPRALVRLLAALAARGESLADQSEIILYWLPGKPPREVYDGPAALAKILGKPIRLLFTDPATEEQMIIPFEP